MVECRTTLGDMIRWMIDDDHLDEDDDPTIGAQVRQGKPHKRDGAGCIPGLPKAYARRAAGIIGADVFIGKT